MNDYSYVVRQFGGVKRIRTSKYSPHQGAKEMTRRVNQIAKGMI